MSKLMKYFIPILFLVVSVVIMLSSGFLKNAFGGKEIPFILDEVMVDVKNDNWNDANNKVDEIKKVYKKISILVQFSAERNEIENFYHQLAMLKGYVEAKQEGEAIATIYLLKEYWAELGT